MACLCMIPVIQSSLHSAVLNSVSFSNFFLGGGGIELHYSVSVAAAPALSSVRAKTSKIFVG